MSEHIQVVTDGPVRHVVFNRPEKKNAFTIAMYEAITAALADADRDPSVRVVLLRANGTAFTGGNDLADFMGNPPTGEDSAVFRLLLRLVEQEKPIVAAVNGVAIGIGVTMLLHCDLVYASPAAQFRMPFVNLALVPEGGSSLLLPKLAGRARASELLLLGDLFDANAAHEIGIVGRVVPPEALDAFALDRARALAAQPPGSVKLTKSLLAAPDREALREALRREGELFVQRLTSPEAMEAFTAFFEKRKPDFSKV